MKAIAAMDLNRVIGYKGKIPWYFSEDLKWFKEFTWGKTLVVGKTTYDGLPPLKNRQLIVLTSNSTELNSKFQTERLSFCQPRNFNPQWYPNGIVAGGAKTYQLLLPHCEELYMTYVIDEHEGDTFMPPFEDLFSTSEIVREEKHFWIVKYTK